MQSYRTFNILETRLAGLAHDCVQDDPVEKLRHERFIVTRMSAGLLALACMPLYLFWRGVPSSIEVFVFACLVMPIAAAGILSLTGKLDWAYALSSTAFAGVILTIASSSGGMASAATIWLVAIPLEALFSGSRRAAIAATIIAMSSAVAVAVLDFGIGPSSAGAWPLDITLPIFAIAAIAHAAAISMAQTRFETYRRLQDRKRDAKDRSLLQAVDDLITWHDKNGLVLEASPAASRLLGVAARALKGKGLFNHVHVPDRPAFLKAISDAANGSSHVAVQFRLHAGLENPRQAPREVIWAEMRVHRVEAGEGENDCAVVAVTRDITDQKKHEDDLDRARASAENADESKGRFLATVSHELRTPLNAIIGFSEILQTEDVVSVTAERRKEYARIIHVSGHHLLEVVNTLLDMSKIETGNFDVVAEPFEPAGLAQGCCDLMQLKAEQAEVGLVRDIAANLPELVADKRACKQILINLLSNALKFTPPDGTVTLSVKRRADRIVFAVADTGIGVAKDDLPRLGDPFFQVRSTYDRAHEGTGLGLSVVRGLVGLHRGSLTIESEIGQGTCVTVSLPIDCRHVATDDKVVVRPGGPEDRSVPLPGFRKSA